MKLNKKILILISILILGISSSIGVYYKFIYQSPEEKALGVVTQMFDNLKRNEDVMGLFTEKFTHTINTADEAYTMTDDTFFVQNALIKDANIVVIGRKGKLSTWQEQIQYFSIKKTGNEYRIDDSINYIIYKNTWYQLAEIPQGLTDNKITKMIESINNGLKMEIVDIQRPNYKPTWTTGTIKVTNNSDYDLTWIRLIVYNYDANGVSVSPDMSFIPNVWKHWRAEVSWTSMNCAECTTHKAELKPYN